MIELALQDGADPNILLFAGLQYKPGWGERLEYSAELSRMPVSSA
jgi:hypothetical protein